MLPAVQISGVTSPEPVHVDMGLHPEVPITAFFGLIHCRAALNVLVGTFAHHQTFLCKVPVDGVEDLARSAFSSKQMTKLQQRRCVQR